MQKITVKMIREMDKEGVRAVLDNYCWGSIITEKDFEQIIKNKTYPLDIENEDEVGIMVLAGALVFKVIKKICTPAAYKTIIDTIKEELQQE